MSKAIADLRHEHDAILMALKILEAMIAAGAGVAREDILGFIGFLREFADKCHHGKEEGILFPALLDAGMPLQGGPINVLLHEHEEGRKHIGSMESAAAGSVDYQRVADAARRYMTLMQEHIQKENNVLFPMAEKMLPAARLETIFEQFELHEETVIGHGRHEELHELLKALRQKYSV